jgi:hypothetical protein
MEVKEASRESQDSDDEDDDDEGGYELVRIGTVGAGG